MCMLQKMELRDKEAIIVRKQKWFSSVYLFTTDWDRENAFVITRDRCKQNTFRANLWGKDQNVCYTVGLG